MSDLFSDPSLDLASFLDEFGPLFRSVEAAMMGNRAGSAEVRVLLALREAEAAMSDVRVRLAMDSGQLTRLCNSLKAKGLLVSRLIGKRSFLSLTERGMSEAHSRHERMSRAAALAFEKLSSHDRERFGASLKILGENFIGYDYQFVVREAEPADSGAVVERMTKLLGSGFYGHDPKKIALALHRHFADLRPNDIVLVAANQRHLAGAVCISPKEDGRSGTLDFLCVFHFTFWGRGLGGLLLDAAVDRARAAGLKSITAAFPRYNDGPSYLSLHRGWEKTRSENHKLYGRPSVIETWSRAL